MLFDGLMTQDTSVLSQLISSNSGCQIWATFQVAGKIARPTIDCQFSGEPQQGTGLRCLRLTLAIVLRAHCHFRSSEPVRKLSSNGPAFRDTLRIDERKLDFDNYRYANPGRFVH